MARLAVGNNTMSAATSLREERFPLLHSRSGMQRPLIAFARKNAMT
jgi:hypothetical protein